MGIINTWFWRNLFWRLEDERCTHDDFFRGHCKVVFIDKPRLGGQSLNRFQIQALCMAPRGSTIVVRLKGNDIAMEVSHPDLIKSGVTNEFFIRADPATLELFLYIELAMFENGPRGLGAVGFLRCAQMCSILGFSRIDLLAAGGKDYKILGGWNPGFNGYYSWARFGFNAPLHPMTAKLIATLPQLAGATDLLDIVERDPDWWRDEGAGGEMTFDLQENSRSWHTLYTYLSNNGYRK